MKRILLASSFLLVPSLAFAQSTQDIGTSGSSQGIVKLESATSGGSVSVQAPATSSARTITLPSGAPTNTYLVQTDGSGNWSYVAAPSGGGGLTDVPFTGSPSPTSSNCNSVYIYTGTATTASTFTLPAISTLTNSCVFVLKWQPSGGKVANPAVITLSINASDHLGNGSAGVGMHLYPGQAVAYIPDTASKHMEQVQRNQYIGHVHARRDRRFVWWHDAFLLRRGIELY